MNGGWVDTQLAKDFPFINFYTLADLQKVQSSGILVSEVDGGLHA